MDGCRREGLNMFVSDGRYVWNALHHAVIAPTSLWRERKSINTISSSRSHRHRVYKRPPAKPPPRHQKQLKWISRKREMAVGLLWRLSDAVFGYYLVHDETSIRPREIRQTLVTSPSSYVYIWESRNPSRERWRWKQQLLCFLGSPVATERVETQTEGKTTSVPSTPRFQSSCIRENQPANNQFQKEEKRLIAARFFFEGSGGDNHRPVALVASDRRILVWFLVFRA